MKGAYVLIGLFLLLFAIIIYPLKVPWIEWKGDLFPTPQYVPFSLAPVAYIFATIGIISIIFGLTEDIALRTLFSFITVMGCIALLTGFISIEKIEEFLEHIKIEV